MPYASKAQRGYLHAHPEITDKKGHPVAAKWDAEIHRAKKGKIKKSKRDWSIGLGTAAVGGAIANQIPPVRRKDIKQVERKLKKKAKIQKMLVPTSDDPYFNQEAAQKAFNLIMKMDDDTAEVFCHIVASDLLEREVEENRVTLQKHLDEVIGQRLEDMKRATARAFSKGIDVDPYVAVMDQVCEEISKADEIPNWAFERKIRRDTTTGRFQAKFHDRAFDKPLPDKTAKAMGIAGITGTGYKGLKPKDKARYQSQYLQIADYLGAVNAATDGNNETLIHYRNDKTGETWADKAISTKPPTTMMDKDIRAVGAETSPNALSVGGAAFSLAGAMGHQMSEQGVTSINQGAESANAFRESWVRDTGAANNNARLYQRTQALGAVASAVGPPNSKVQLAGRMAEIVGQYGPQAEEVLGPSARKTAYRYRGTERTPDDRLVKEYGDAIEQNKKQGPLDPWGEQELNRIKQARGAGQQPFGSETGVRAKGSSRRPLEPGTAPSLQQMVREREARAGRAPDWQERELGRVAVQRYLVDQLPSKQHYKLQLASGNTPPSEGVIINSKGQIVTQAVGYGDDHYLPFNLKNLKGLKGGEYVRNRSVGGLTSEDIYTGLISGARRVTVVSRSGTFTMEFKQDFRGGRRHNDKARRMTRRYEQILDAVQSEQVERQDVPPRWKKIIENEVRSEYGPSASQRLIRAEIDARTTEFKKNPQIDGRDLDRAESEISRFEEQEKQGLVSRQDVADYRKQVMGELRDLKEIHFRLNGVGYTAALDSLREQFPYYINAQSVPKEEHLEEYERDLGYVEPARNRPTAASAGWYGTNKEESGKYSAAHADYQRGMPGTPTPTRLPPAGGKFRATGATNDIAGTSGSSGGGRDYSSRESSQDKIAEAFEASEAKEKVKRNAVALQQAIKNKQIARPTGEAVPEWWGKTADEMSEYVDNGENLKKFDAWAQAKGQQLNATDATEEWTAYSNAVNRSGGGQDYKAAHATSWLSSPYKFPSDREAYRPSADLAAVQVEINQIDGSDASLKFGVPLGQLDQRQLREEFDLAKRAHEAMKSTGITGDQAQHGMTSQFENPGSAFVSQFFRSGGSERHLENIHRMRALKTKTGWRGGGGAPPAAGGAWRGSPGQPGDGAAGVPAQPAGPSGGHLVRMEASEEETAAGQKQIEEARQNWVKAATAAQAAATEPDDISDLGNFVAGMQNEKGSLAGFKAHDKWLDELRPGVRDQLNRAYAGVRQ